MPHRHRVVIIGAGFGGLGLGHALSTSGIDDYVILEKGPGVGGVWRDNGYPGAACDVPSHLYSFSFEPKLDWSRKYAPRAEILAYLTHVADKYGIRSHVRSDNEVTRAVFDERRAQWTVETRTGEVFEAEILVSAVGQLSRPAIPRLRGLDTFKGPAFHSAAWDRAFDPRGKTVAVIGTGASAIQIVPALQPIVRKLSLFQRSAAYLVPRNDRAYSPIELSLLKRFPTLHTLSRGLTYGLLELRMVGFLYPDLALPALQKQCEEHLAKAVRDPILRKKLTPDYPIGCKRVLLSDDYFPALTQPNAEVITDAISHLEADAIVTADGVRHEVDAIVFGTGFHATEFLSPIQIVGTGGALLEERWRDGAEAYLGVTVHGFPNLFMLYGPNTNLGHTSIVYMIESQIRYVMEALRLLDRENLATAEVRSQVQTAFNRDLQARLSKMVWSADCTNWYKTASGKSTNNWPGYTFAYRAATRSIRASDYLLTPRKAAPTHATVPVRKPLSQLN